IGRLVLRQARKPHPSIQDPCSPPSKSLRLSEHRGAPGANRVRTGVPSGPGPVRGARRHRRRCRGRRQYHARVTTNGSSGALGTLRAAAREAVSAALGRAIDAGRLPDAPEARGVAVEVSRPANPEHGDLATNVALKLARPLRMAPPAIAGVVAESIALDGAIASAEAAGPGFVNLRFADAALEAILDRARHDSAGWGRVAPGERSSRHVNVEFV